MAGEERNKQQRERHSIPGLLADLHCRITIPNSTEDLAAFTGRVWDFSNSGACILLRGQHSIAENEHYTIEITDTLSLEKATFKGQSVWSRRNTTNTYLGFKFQNPINLKESIFRSFTPNSRWLAVNEGFSISPSSTFINLN
jgi:c-di-GMP-binding flagellar brake protein YcgR